MRHGTAFVISASFHVSHCTPINFNNALMKRQIFKCSTDINILKVFCFEFLLTGIQYEQITVIIY